MPVEAIGSQTFAVVAFLLVIWNMSLDYGMTHSRGILKGSQLFTAHLTSQRICASSFFGICLCSNQWVWSPSEIPGRVFPVPLPRCTLCTTHGSLPVWFDLFLSTALVYWILANVPESRRILTIQMITTSSLRSSYIGWVRFRLLCWTAWTSIFFPCFYCRACIHTAWQTIQMHPLFMKHCHLLAYSYLEKLASSSRTAP